MTNPITIENELVRITFTSQQYIHLHYLTKELTLQKSKEVLSLTRQHCPWSISPLLITGGDFMSDDRESRAFNSSGEVTQYCSAIAFVSDTLAKKILANFFISMFKLNVPVRYFNKEEEAIEWLLKFPTISKEVVDAKTVIF